MSDTNNKAPPPSDDEESFAALFEESLKSSAAPPGEARSRRGGFAAVQVGQTVQGKLLQFGTEWAFLDIGAKGEALMATSELIDAEGKATAVPGDLIEGRVVRIGADGIIVSRVLQKGRDGRAMLEEAHQLRMPVEGVVKAVVKGGLEVEIAGARAFCPASQIDLRYVEDLNAFVGQRFPFRVTEYREGGRSVVVSRRALLEEEQEKRAQETRKTLGIGAILSGTVTSLREYGAFIDLGGIEGLAHISELAHGRVQRAADVLQVGQSITVQVIKMEGDKISLSLKALAGDPWDKAAETYAEGTRHHGVVTRVQPFGAFVELAPGIEGLLHVSNLADTRIKDARRAFSEGQEVEVTVISLDLPRHRLGLAPSSAAGASVDLTTGAVFVGQVERVESYGVFVRMPGPPVGGRPTRGLIPLEEIGPTKGDLRREFPTGSEVKVMLLEPDAQGRVRLSRRAALDAEERAEAAEFMGGAAAPTGFGTLGDLLSKRGDEKKKR
jgi:small subunit ribosomal protein S1